jgi:hypothetical protein
LAERDELDDLDKKDLEDDPWQPQNMLPMEDAETGEFLVFVSGSFGGKIAIEKLCNRVARDLSAGRDLGAPTVKLDITDFKTKQYGTVPHPEFTIVSWENEDRKDVVLPPAPPPPLSAAKDFNEIIPF